MKTNDHSILNVLDKSTGYDTVLFTTFNFEIPFFERYIFPLLAKNNIQFVNLFVDCAQLNHAVADDCLSYLFGKEYFVTPVAINGAFHPKTILLLGDNKAKLIVTSANIKLSGYMHNNEIYNIFDYSLNDNEYANIIYSAIEFYKDLYEIGITQDSDIKKKLDTFQISPISNNKTSSLIHNVKTPIIDQLFSRINEDVRCINIAVPFYDKNLDALKEIMKRSSCSNVRLFIQNNKNTFPIDYNNQFNVIPREAINLYKNINSYKETPSFYHGKVIELITDHHSYILYGSSNCSSNALLRTYKEYGNIECDVIAEDSYDANKQFFESFIVENELQIESGFLGSESTDLPEYSFVYGEKTSEIVKLYISYRSISNLTVSYNKENLDYVYLDDYLVVTIPQELLLLGERIFTIELRNTLTQTDIKCWYNDTAELLKYRYFSQEPALKNITSDDDLEKYESYYVELLNAMNAYNEWFDISNKIHSTQSDNNPDDMDEDEINEIYMLDEDVKFTPSEQQQSYAIYRNAAVLSGRYFRSLFKENSNNKNLLQTATVPDTLEYPPIAKTSRKATSAEKRLGRFFKISINHFLSVAKEEDFSYERILSFFGTISDLIERLYYRGKVKDFLGIDYILDIKTKFIRLLLKKSYSLNSMEDKEAIVAIVLRLLIEREYMEFNTKGDTIPESLLYAINELLNFRETLSDRISLLDLSLIDTDESQEALLRFGYQYIDSLFGYKTQSQLISLLQNTYNGKIELQVFNRQLNIHVLSSDLKVPKEGLSSKVISEINSYITGYKLNISIICFNFIEQDTNNRIHYSMKTDGTNVSHVIRDQYLNNNNYSFKCVLRNNMWKINPFE